MKTSLEQLYSEHNGKVSDKWAIYLSEYHRLLSDFRDRPIHMLEIGIQNGGSLEIWNQYFLHAEKIVGCDINPDCAQLKYDDPKISVIVGDANTDEVERQALRQTTNFDLIIDDGSHKSSDIVRSFVRYFPYLNDGGIFIAEDLHCSYLPDFEGGVFHPYSSIAFFKLLADIVNYEHWGVKTGRLNLLSEFTKKYGVSFDEALLGHVHSVEFINSMCIIRKAPPAANILGKRIVAGSVEAVVPGHLSLKGSDSDTLNQARNNNTVEKKPEDSVSGLFKEEIERLLGKLAERDETIAERDNYIIALQGSTSWRITQPLRDIISYFKSALR